MFVRNGCSAADKESQHWSSRSEDLLHRLMRLCLVDRSEVTLPESGNVENQGRERVRRKKSVMVIVDVCELLVLSDLDNKDCALLFGGYNR